MEQIIKNLILSGITLNDIYHSSGATKTAINNVFKSINRHTLFKYGWNTPRIRTEKALFSLHRKYEYQRNSFLDNDVSFDYIIFEENTPKLAIAYLGPYHLVYDSTPVYKQTIYDCAVKNLHKQEETCKTNNVPFFILPFLEALDNPFLAHDFRNSINDFKYASNHNIESKENYLDLFSLHVCHDDNFKDVKSSEICGCCNCGAVLNSTQITVSDQSDSSACPLCGKYSIITESQGFCINEDFMKRLIQLHKFLPEYRY